MFPCFELSHLTHVLSSWSRYLVHALRSTFDSSQTLLSGQTALLCVHVLGWWTSKEGDGLKGFEAWGTTIQRPAPQNVAHSWGAQAKKPPLPPVSLSLFSRTDPMMDYERRQVEGFEAWMTIGKCTVWWHGPAPILSRVKMKTMSESSCF